MKQSKSVVGNIWGQFYSLKLTITLFIILALASIIGTVVPQNASHQEYHRLYEFHRESRLAPKALVAYARILADGYGKKNEAIETYKFVLAKYPQSGLEYYIRDELIRLKKL